ncbi:hypothetical protein SUGI_0956050 [Cryptomeria japonica]|nr:hypothetical protein SUGI_0956050 [Cryptomeria japonica]
MAIKKIVGDDGNASDHRYWVNCDILTLFVSILLKVGILIFEVVQLCKAVFRAGFLGDLNTIVNNVDDNLMVPFPVDYRSPRDPQAGHRNERDVLWHSQESPSSVDMDGLSIPAALGFILEGGKRGSEMDPSSATKCPPPHADCVYVDCNLFGKGKGMRK